MVQELSARQQKEARDAARSFEADLVDHPDERGEILVEAAYQWRTAGEHEHALVLLGEATALGGEDGAVARVELAEAMFALGRDDDAVAALAQLREQRPSSPMAYQLAAELMNERGAHQEALTWINMAVSRLDDEELEQRHEPEPTHTNALLGYRRRIRQTIGLPADEFDESVQFAPAFDDVAELAGDPDSGMPSQVRILFWPRAEVAGAHRQWPDLVEDPDPETHLRERERANRELSENGCPKIVMVPLTVAGLIDFAARTGGTPADEHTRRTYLDELVDQGAEIDWPPGRNAQCWCGSGTKYKKCCGRPQLEG